MRIDLKLDPGSPLWVYGFPTTGKTSFQRALRFLNREQREHLHLASVVDATDTDDWLGTFKLSQCSPELKKEVKDNCRASMLLTDRLPSDHPRVIVTNLWDRLAECNIKPALICLPTSVDTVRKRVEARGDTHPEWITKQAQEWLDHIKSSQWFKDNQEVVREVDENTFLSDCVSINGVPFSYRFLRDDCVIDIGADCNSSDSNGADALDQAGQALPAEVSPPRESRRRNDWSDEDWNKIEWLDEMKLDTYNGIIISAIKTPFLTRDEAGMVWPLGPAWYGIEISALREPDTYWRSVLVHEVNHLVNLVFKDIKEKDRCLEPEAYLSDSLYGWLEPIFFKEEV